MQIFTKATDIRLAFLTMVSEFVGPRTGDEAAAEASTSLLCSFSQQLALAALIISAL